MAIVIEGVTGVGRQAMLDGLKALQSEHHAVVAAPALRPLNYVRLTDGRVVHTVEVDFARGFKGCVRIAFGGEWLALGPAPSAAWTAECEPWVPRVGERVRHETLPGKGMVTGVEGNGGDDGTLVRIAFAIGSATLGLSVLSPVLDATGRPVVEPAHAVANPLSPAAQSVRDAFVGAGQQLGPVGDFCGAVTIPAGSLVTGGGALTSDGRLLPVNVTRDAQGRMWASVMRGEPKPREWTPRAGDRCYVPIPSAGNSTTPGTVCEPRGEMVPGSVCVMLDGERAPRCYVNVSPLCPWQKGQRVRCADGRVGRVEALHVDVNGLHCVRVGPDGPAGRHTDEPRGSLVVVAESVPSYVPRIGDRVRAKGRTGVVIDLVYGVDADRPTECVITWDALAPGTRGEHVEPEWHRSAWPWLELLAPADLVRIDAPAARTDSEQAEGLRHAEAALRHYAVPGTVRVEGGTPSAQWLVEYTARRDGRIHGLKGGSVRMICACLADAEAKRARGLEPETLTSAVAAPVETPPPCGKRTHATRPPGTTCVHWWPCGCAVEPDGEDALGLVDGSPRGVLVWGHGAIGEGFTREDAVSEWRAELAGVQDRDDRCERGEFGPPAAWHKRMERMRAIDLARTQARHAARKANAWSDEHRHNLTAGALAVKPGAKPSRAALALGDFAETRRYDAHLDAVECSRHVAGLRAGGGRVLGTAIADSAPGTDGKHRVTVQIDGGAFASAAQAVRDLGATIAAHIDGGRR